MSQRKPEELSISISRTVQPQQYQPLTITITEKHVLDEGEDAKEVRSEVYRQVAADLSRFVEREFKRYSSESE